MLSLKAVRERLSEAPFTPFRLCLSDGRRVLVKHPDYVAVGGSLVVVTDDADDVQRIDSLHIVSLDDERQGKQRGKRERR